MSKSLALLSGKGGSGKTSLALSISSLLDQCDLKVLLVDCDLSTNGATYFYEDRLNERTHELCTFYSFFFESEAIFNINIDKILHSNKKPELADIDKAVSDHFSYLKITNNIDFLPSISKLANRISDFYQYSSEDRLIMSWLDAIWRKKYDVIIYDCQAGFSSILKTIMPVVDVNLMVIEDDAISSASFRSLFFKIGPMLNGKKIYQVINKIREEEYEAYAKTSNGLFTNIESVIFDWKIRDAFKHAKVPDMSNTSAHYGQQIYNICSFLFREERIQNALGKFEKLIKLNDYKEQEKRLNNTIKKIEEEKLVKRSRLLKSFYWFAVPFFLVFTFILFYFGIENGIYDKYFTIVLVVFYILAAISFILFGLLDRYKTIKKKHQEDESVYRARAKIKFDRMTLESEINHLDAVLPNENTKSEDMSR